MSGQQNGRGWRVFLRASGKAKTSFVRAILLGVLISQLALPPRALAPPDPPPAASQPGDGQLPGFLPAAERATGPGTRLPLTPEQRNPGLIQRQELVERAGGRTWDLTALDVASPEVMIPPGLLEWALEVTPIPHGVQLSYRGAKYDKKIYFRDGRSVRSIAQDNEFVFLLLDDGSLYAIDVSSLRFSIFAGQTYVYYVTRFDPAQLGDAGARATSVRFLQRRFVPADQSRAAQETSLILNPAAMSRVERIADAQTVEGLERSLEQVRPVPLHPRLAARYEEASRRNAQALAEARAEQARAGVRDEVRPPPPFVFDAGSVALVTGDGDEARVVGLVPRPAAAAAIGLQNVFVSGEVRLAQFLTEPDPVAAARRARALSPEAWGELDRILSDETTLIRFANEDLEAILQFPEASLDGTDAHVRQILNVEATRRRLGLPVRDRFTLAEWEHDFGAFREHVGRARQTADSARIPKMWRRILVAMADKARSIDWVKGLKKVGKLLAYGTGFAVADHALTGGAVLGYAADVLAGCLGWTMAHVPVLADVDYRSLLASSFAWQVALSNAVFLVAALAKPFTQFSVTRLMAVTGIRAYARLQISPGRLFAWIFGQQASRRAASMGYPGWVPVLATPEEKDRAIQRIFEIEEGGARPGDPTTVPILASRETRRAAVTAMNERITQGQKRHALARLLAVWEYATTNGIDPGRCAQALYGNPAALTEVIEKSETIHEIFESVPKEEWAEALRAEPGTFMATLKALRDKQLEIRAAELAQRKTFGQWLKRVVTLRFLRKGATLGDNIYKELANALPDDTSAMLSAQSFFVDNLITIGTESLYGSLADLSNPSMLTAQPHAPFNTHPIALASTATNDLSHLLAGASTNYLVMSRGVDTTNSAYRPAELVDGLAATGVRNPMSEGLHFLRGLFDQRNFSATEKLADMMVRRRILLLQSTFIMMLMPRLLLTGQGLHAGVIGTLSVIAGAVFCYGWPWPLLIQATSATAVAMEANKEKYDAALVGLSQGLRFQDDVMLESAVGRMRELYDLRDLRLADDEDLQNRLLDRHPEESLRSYAQRLYGLALAYPPVPGRANRMIGITATSIVAVTTTVLNTFLLTASFSDRDWTSVDWSKWELFSGISPGDGVLAIVGKAAIWTWMLWFGGRLFNVGWDYARLTIPGFMRPKNPVEEAALRERFDKAKEKLFQALGKGLLFGRAVQPVVAAEGPESAMARTCKEWMEAASGSTPAMATPQRPTGTQ